MIFILSLVACAFILTFVFELYFVGLETQVKLSFAQFWGLCLQLAPYCFFLANLFSFSFILKNDLRWGFAGLLLTSMIVVGIFAFYFFAQNSEKADTDFVLQALNTVRTTNHNFSFSFLQKIFSACKVFVDDWFLVAQINLKSYLLFSFSFWSSIISYMFITKNCTSWALLNFIFMLLLSLGSFFLYTYLQSASFEALAEETFLRNIMSSLTMIVFFCISILCFSFFAIKALFQKLIEKKE